MTKYEQLRNLLQTNNGYLFTQDVERSGISRTYLARYVKDNELERVANGVYISQETWEDELFILQHSYPNVVYSGETALYLHSMIDREYSKIYITVPQGFCRTRLHKRGIQVHQERRELYEMGIIEMTTNYGNIVRTYDKERCVCNLIKSRGDIEVQQFEAVIKTYMRSRDKNLTQLMRYAAALGNKDEVMKYVEMML